MPIEGGVALQVGLHDEMAYIAQRNIDSVTLIPRNHLKSTIMTINRAVWLLGKNPNLRILIGTDTLPVAAKFIKAIKDNIEQNKRLQMVFPNLKPASKSKSRRDYRKWSEYEIEVERTKLVKEPSVLAISAGQTKTGLHFDVGLFDDIVTQDNAKDIEGVKKVSAWYFWAQNLLDRGSFQSIPGTRYHDADIYGQIIEQKMMPVYMRKVMETGEYIWPDPSNIAWVERQRKLLPPSIFSSQYMNNPISEEAQEFKESWLRYWDIDFVREELGAKAPDDDQDCLRMWYSTLHIFIGGDAARTKKKKSDYGVVLVGGADKRGRLYVLDYIRKRMLGPEYREKYCDMFEKWDDYNLVSGKFEALGGEEHLYHEIEIELKKRKLPAYKFSRYNNKLRIDNEERIKSFTQNAFYDGMIYFKRGVESAEIENEFLRLGAYAHDDIATVIAYMWKQQVKPRKERVQKAEKYGWRTKRVTAFNPVGSWRTA